MEDWAKGARSDIYAEMIENYLSPRRSHSHPDDDSKKEKHLAALEQLRDALRACIKKGDIELKIRPGNPSKRPELISNEFLSEIIDSIGMMTWPHYHHLEAYFCGKRIPIGVYRPGELKIRGNLKRIVPKTYHELPKHKQDERGPRGGSEPVARTICARAKPPIPISQLESVKRELRKIISRTREPRRA